MVTGKVGGGLWHTSKAAVSPSQASQSTSQALGLYIESYGSLTLGRAVSPTDPSISPLAC